MKKDSLEQWFEEVAAKAVREPVRQAVALMLAVVEHDLHLPPVSVRWFRPRKGKVPPWKRKNGRKLREVDPAYMSLNRGSNPRRLSGLAVAMKRESLIWLRATMQTENIVIIAAHEARHLWQFRNWTGEESRRQAERDATDYAWEVSFDYCIEERKMNRENKGIYKKAQSAK